MALYVMADVHGYYSIMKNVLDNKGFFESDENKLVLCGDAFDRGVEALQMMNFLTELSEKGRLIYIRGNHEDLMENMLVDIKKGKAFIIASGMSHHYTNGTWDTALNITGMDEIEAIHNEEQLLEKMYASDLFTKLLPGCVDYYETDKYIFTHGFIPVEEMGRGSNLLYLYNPEWRNATKQEWDRARWLNGMRVACKHRIREEGKTIVVGHYNTSWGHHNISHKCQEWGRGAIFTPFEDTENGIIALDACTAVSKRINCIVIE